MIGWTSNCGGDAEAFAHARAVTIIAKAMLDDWKAAAWYLERKYHDQWGRRDRDFAPGAIAQNRVVTLPPSGVPLLLMLPFVLSPWP